MNQESLRAHLKGQVEGHQALHGKSLSAELELKRQLEQAVANTHFLAGKLTAFQEVLAAMPKAEALPGKGGDVG